MAIRIAHGLTPALSGAAGFFSDKEKDADRRGAVAAGAANQSFALSQRKREAAFSQEMQMLDFGRQEERDAASDSKWAAERQDRKSKDAADRGMQQAESIDRHNREVARMVGLPGGSGDNVSQEAGAAKASPRSAPAGPGQPPEQMPNSGPLQGMPPGSYLKNGMPPGAQVVGVDSPWQPSPVFKQRSDTIKRASEIRANMSKSAYTPEGKRIASELSGKLRAIEDRQSELRPQQHDDLLNKWIGEYEQSMLDNYVQRPPTVDSEMEGRFKDFGTGYGAFLQPNNEFKVFEIDPAKTAQSREGGSAMSGMDSSSSDPASQAAKRMQVAGLLKDEKARQAYKKQAVDSMLEERRNAVISKMGDPASVSERDFNAKEVADRMYEMAELEADIQNSIQQRISPPSAMSQDGMQAGRYGQSSDQARSLPPKMTWGEMMGGVKPDSPSSQAATWGEMMGGVNPDSGQPVASQQQASPQTGAQGSGDIRDAIRSAMQTRIQSGDAPFMQQYDGIAAKLKEQKRDNMSPEDLIHPWAVTAAKMSGQEDPVGYAMKVAGDALKSGDKHIATMSGMEREMHELNGVPKFIGTPEQVQAQADKLPFNTFYYDADGYLRQRRPGPNERYRQRPNAGEWAPASNQDTGRYIGMP